MNVEPRKYKHEWDDPKFWESLKDENGTSVRSFRWIMIHFGIGVPSVIQNQMKKFGLKPKDSGLNSVGKTYSQMIEETENRKIPKKPTKKKTAIDIFNERLKNTTIGKGK